MLLCLPIRYHDGAARGSYRMSSELLSSQVERMTLECTMKNSGAHSRIGVVRTD